MNSITKFCLVPTTVRCPLLSGYCYWFQISTINITNILFQVSQNEVLQSVDRAIEVIHYEASSKGGQYSHTQRENLK